MKGFVTEFTERTDSMNAKITEEELRWVVITPENPFGDITKEEFKMITDSKF